MRDLDFAKLALKERHLSLVIVKNQENIFESCSSGISGLLDAVERLSTKLYGSSVADKIVGRAAALLIVYSRIKEVYAVLLSREGLKVLKENNISIEYNRLIPKVLDRTAMDICPFEEFSLTIKSPNDAYRMLKDCAEKIRSEK